MQHNLIISVIPQEWKLQIKSVTDCIVDVMESTYEEAFRRSKIAAQMYHKINYCETKISFTSHKMVNDLSSSYYCGRNELKL